VQRQAFFGGVALVVMIGMSMMSPAMVQAAGGDGLCRLADGADAVAGIRHRFRQGRGALVFASALPVQPSEFLKPSFVIAVAWLIAASQDLNGPPGKSVSFALTLLVVAFLAMQPDFGQSALIVFAWG
jgi:cell division protein FtsW